MVAPQEQFNVILQELVRRANSHTQRFKVVDEKIRGLQAKIDSMEEAKIRMEKIFNEKIDKLDSKMEEIKKNIESLEDRISKLEEQSKKFARKSEVEELSEFIHLISPIKNEFVTWKELTRELDKLKREIKGKVW